MPTMRRLALALLCVLVPAVPAAAQGPLQRAREELGIERPLPTRWPLPNGDLEVGPSELLASSAGTPIRFTVRLERAIPGGALFVGLPQTRPGRSGLRGLRGAARLEIPFAGDRLVHSTAIEHVGLRAGTYRLALAMRDATGRERPAGAAWLRVLAPAREGAPSRPWRGTDVTRDDVDQSEPFATVTPGDPRRIVTASNPGATEPTLSAWLSLDGGATWSRRPLPEAIDVPGRPLPEPGELCCDPMLAAVAGGDTWVGGLTYRVPETGPVSARSRIVVNRISAQTGAFAPHTVGLPARTDAIQDKPMMTAGDDGRLWVVWIEPSAEDLGAVSVVLSGCDASQGPAEDPGAHCEDADNWSEPVDVTPAPGSYTYPDVAAAPGGGDVHVTWWDYSAQENGIRGATCAAPCGLPAFGAPATVALLNATGGRPLPFGCPVPAAPGGRAGAVPSVEAGGGRVWVAWADLRPGSGSTRCEETSGGLFTAPRMSQLSWDAYVASAAGGLPGRSAPSAEVGTPLVVDGDEGVAASSDELFPWLAVDPVYGEAWAALYSTGHDPTRGSAHYVAMSAAPDGAGGHLVGPANRVSTGASSFSGAPCCEFGNDFGDYAGLAVTNRVVVPAWIDTAGGDADLWAAAGPLTTVGFDLVYATVTEASGDGDGALEAGESALVLPVLRNTGTRTATGFASAGPTGTLGSPTPGATVARGEVTWPAVAAGDVSAAPQPFEVALDARYDCATPLTLRLAVATPQGSETLEFVHAVACPPGGGVPPVATPGPVAPARGLARLVVPRQRLATALRRGLLVEVGCTRDCTATVTADLDALPSRRLRIRRRVATALVNPAGSEVRRIRLPLRARARRALRRTSSMRLRVRATVAAPESGGTPMLTRLVRVR